jgi:hypothetical protein
LLAVAVVLTGCGNGRARATPSLTTTTPTTVTNARVHTPKATTPPPPVPAALYKAGLDVRAGPVPVPLRLQIPTLHIDTSVLGVGVTPIDTMDAPEGPVGSPVWEQAFWYRGSAVPGVISTALIAGHIDGPQGTQGVFGHIDQLRPGDPIVIHDTRTGLNVRFAVTSTATFTLAQTTEKSVLRQIYGVGPVAGTTPQRAKDGLAHLTLITCAGTFRNGTHDHRLVVYATRVV